MDTLPFNVIDNIVSFSDLSSIRNLRLTCKCLNNHVKKSLWKTLVVKHDYVSDVLPSTIHTVSRPHISITRYNITALMACDHGRDSPLIAEMLPLVETIQIGGLTPPPPAGESGSTTQHLLNKKFIDQLFIRLLSDIIPLYATGLDYFDIVGNRYAYIPETSPIYTLIQNTNSKRGWEFDLPQTPLTVDFILFALQSDHLVRARIVVMSEFLDDNDDNWLSEENGVELPSTLKVLTVESDSPGKVSIQQSSDVCRRLFKHSRNLETLTLSGLNLNTKLFRVIPPSVKDLTIAKCQITGSDIAKVSVNHLVLDTQQELAPSVNLVAGKMERVNIATVKMDCV